MAKNTLHVGTITAKDKSKSSSVVLVSLSASTLTTIILDMISLSTGMKSLSIAKETYIRINSAGTVNKYDMLG